MSKGFSLRKLCASLFVAVCLVLPTIISPSAFAASNSQTIWRKMLVRAMWDCYSSTYRKTTVHSYDYHTAGDAFTNTGAFINPDGGKMTCREVYNKADTEFGKTPTLEQLGYLAKGDKRHQTRCVTITYIETPIIENSSGSYTGTPKTQTVGKYCFRVEERTSQGKTSFVITNGLVDAQHNGGAISVDTSSGLRMDFSVTGTQRDVVGDRSATTYTAAASYYSQSWDTFLSNLSSALNTLNEGFKLNDFQVKGNLLSGAGYKLEIQAIEQADTYTDNITDGNSQLELMRFYTGNEEFDIRNYKFNTDDVLFLQEQAFQKMKDDQVIRTGQCSSDWNEIAQQTGVEYVHYDNSNKLWCQITIVNNNLKTYPLVNKDYVKLALFTPEQILVAIQDDNWRDETSQCVAQATDWLNNLNAEYKKIPSDDFSQSQKRSQLLQALTKMRDILKNNGEGAYTVSGSGDSRVVTCVDLPQVPGVTDDWSQDSGIITNPDAVQDNSGDNNEATCMDATAVGWIICPVLKLMGNAVEGIYDHIVEDFLNIDSSLMAEDSGANIGWGQVRDITNIIFVIILAVIILSQVTGIGVSNYGVKKILPLLVLTVILVNLSFILCQIAVDLSNILGSGLYEFFHGLPTGTSGSGEGGAVSGVVMTLLGAVGLGAGGVVAIQQLPALLPLLLLALLSGLISIIFFFALLAVRKAGILILVILAPAAIVCYALPNTKKYFDKWLKIFTSLLMVYPICGALMGGGFFASNLLLKNDPNSFWMNLVGLLLQVVPFFFIPTILRSSMAGIGNLGTRLSNFGSRFGRGVTGRVSKSDSFQDWQRRGNLATATRRYNRLNEGKGFRNRMAGLVGRDTKLGQRLTAASDRAQARARRAIDHGAQEDMDAADNREPLIPGTQRWNTEMLNRQARIAEDNARAYETQYASDGTADSVSRMQSVYEAALNDLIADANNDDAKARLTAAERILLRTDLGRAKMQTARADAGIALARSGDNYNAGYRWAAGSLLRESKGSIKATNRSDHELLSAIAAGDSVGDMNIHYDSQGMVHSKHDLTGITGYTSQQLADADDATRDNIMWQLSSPHSQLSGQNKLLLAATAQDAIANDQISVKPKVMRDLQSMANSIYDSTAAISHASDAELKRIANGLVNGSISKNDAVIRHARNAVNSHTITDPDRLALFQQIVTNANNQLI